MYKVRTLPVRFATKKLGEDRSSHSSNIKHQRFLASAQRRTQPCIFQIAAFCACVWHSEDRLGSPVRQTRLPLELDGGVVVLVTRGIWKNELKIFWFTRGQRLGLTASTDLLWTPYIQCLKRQGVFFPPREANVFFTRTAVCGLVKRWRKVTERLLYLKRSPPSFFFLHRLDSFPMWILLSG